jgi:hypothetical protein
MDLAQPRKDVSGDTRQQMSGGQHARSVQPRIRDIVHATTRAAWFYLSPLLLPSADKASRTLEP